MKMSRSSLAALTVTFVAGAQIGCGPEREVTETQSASSLAAALTSPTPNPPPESCGSRHSGVTAIQVVVRIDEYQGLIHGRNGTHEIAHGTITSTPWVYDDGIIDTSNVQLAL